MVVAHRLKVLCNHHGGQLDAAFQASLVLSARPRKALEEAVWRTVYLARYARIPPSDQEGRSSRELWGWVKQAAKFLEMEAGKSRMVGEGEDH